MSGNRRSWPLGLGAPLPLDPRGFDPPPIPVFVSGLVPTVVAITTHSFSYRDLTRVGLSLHHKVVWRSGHGKLIWSAVNDWQNSRKIVVRRRARCSPLERRRLPWIRAHLLTFENAPNKIEVKDNLGEHRDNRSNGNEDYQRMKRVEPSVFCKLCITTRHSHHAHRMHGNEDAIDADEGYPEM